MMLSLMFLAAIIGHGYADHWALIVAGSSGYFNYRHQADACHAYQILHRNGIPDDHIIVMMYDDIAHNKRNPTPGQIINKPGGEDVYAGVLKDYTGEDVTPENFLNILTGNKTAMQGIGSGKVIDSGPDDLVFVNFADHGAPNLIAFPEGELHAKDLQQAIDYMNTTNRYKQMVLYIEACESGSMFDRHKLSPNINVFATTAANGHESSYACYWDEKRRTYLGDVYSVNWMEDSDKEDITVETLQKQFEIVREETNTSHCQEFGNLTMGQEPIGFFQGMGSPAMKPNFKGTPKVPITDAIPSPDVPLAILYKSLELAKTEEEKRHLLQEIKYEEESRLRIKATMEKIAERLVPHRQSLRKVLETSASPREEFCYKEAVTLFRKQCFNFTKYEHALRHIYVLANLCDRKELSIYRILNVIMEVCPMQMPI